MKVIVLNRGGLTDKLGMFLFGTDNPCSDVWLNGQESAEAIVPDGVCLKGRAER